jgi:hypothetical protein
VNLCKSGNSDHDFPDLRIRLEIFAGLDRAKCPMNWMVVSNPISNGLTVVTGLDRRLARAVS